MTISVTDAVTISVTISVSVSVTISAIAHVTVSVATDMTADAAPGARLAFTIIGPARSSTICSRCHGSSQRRRRHCPAAAAPPRRTRPRRRRPAAGGLLPQRAIGGDIGAVFVLGGVPSAVHALLLLLLPVHVCERARACVPSCVCPGGGEGIGGGPLLGEAEVGDLAPQAAVDAA